MAYLSTAIIIKGYNEKGFTLLEVIVAISVLTIGLLGVASMQVSAIKGNTLAFTEGISPAPGVVEAMFFETLTGDGIVLGLREWA